MVENQRARPSPHIGRVLLNARVFNFRNREESTAGPVEDSVEDVLQTVARFFDLLREREVEYVLVGGVALLQYVEGRNTEDLDLIMTASSLEKLPEVEIIERDPNFVRAVFQGLQIDVLLTRHPLFEKVRREHAATRPFREQEIRCGTVEGLILLKLYALPSLYRQGDFARVGLYENDLATLLHAYDPDLAPLFDELARHLSATDLDEVKVIVAELQQRLERFRERTNNHNRANDRQKL